MPQTLKKYLIPAVLLLLGIIAASILLPIEQAEVDHQLIGYPDSDKQAHDLRVWLLGALCILPFIGSVIYQCLGTMDRYLVRSFLNSFLICFGALFIIMFLEDLQDNLSDFKQSDSVLSIMVRHYITKLPALIVFILPYSLMLSLLWCLGKLSRSQEIVSMIQTGRSVTRIVAPLVGFGLFCTVTCHIFNYYWAPNADRLEAEILLEAKGETVSAANAVAYQNHDDSRHWFVGTFPFAHSQGAPLESVIIYFIDEKKGITKALYSEKATWSKDTKLWTLSKPTIYDSTKPVIPDMPSITKSQEDLVVDWKETPWQIIKPGLKAPYLGIPGLKSWLANHKENPLSDKRSYLTHLYYRFAQPFICLITILLAAPLGIVFTRRGLGGGVAVAIFLCAGMIFCSTVFPTLGESGHLPPFIAAWATNILFTLIALYLFRRRMTGQPIYQIIKNLIPSSE